MIKSPTLKSSMDAARELGGRLQARCLKAMRFSFMSAAVLVFHGQTIFSPLTGLLGFRLPTIVVGSWFFPQTVSARPTQPSVKEYQVKATFLCNLAQFVDWPAAAYPVADAPMTIGVLGENPFAGALEEAVRDEQAHGRALQVRHFRRVEDVADCQVLFICRSESDRLESILAALRGRSILTVGDFEGFAKRGGMVRFVSKKKKIRMRISPDAAATAGLTISSKLLRAAEIIRVGKD